MSEYGKIRKQIITDIADAIRFHKGTTRTYKPEDYARIIKAMLVLPSGEASATLNIGDLQLASTASCILPTVYKGAASSTLDMSELVLTTSAVGELTE